ncbi:MAG TPA: hypothetical protein VHG51_10235 [Longimicrobiaceae bacterium]|nr:hypothetical protein [Longimicrobiaceae bacterium]
MTPLRAVAVDDEPLARRRIVRLLKREPEVEVVAVCGEGQEAVRAVSLAAPPVPRRWSASWSRTGGRWSSAAWPTWTGSRPRGTTCACTPAPAPGWSAGGSTRWRRATPDQFARIHRGRLLHQKIE